MVSNTRQFSRLVGTGSYLPEKVLTNAALEKLVDTSNDWIIERTGIHERRIVAADESAASMAKIAAERALENAGVASKELDLIIVATSTPDKLFPSTACVLQQSLGALNSPAFDLSAACAGFIYGLDIADKFIKTGSAKRVLVVGSEAMSRIIDWSDRNTCILFGDGAGACVLAASDNPGVYSTHIHADGNFKDVLYVSNGFATENDSSHKPLIRMTKGSEVFRSAVKSLEAIVDETLKANQLEKSDIDWLVPHQANIRIIQSIAKKVNLPLEQVIMTIARHGNTSAASIPLALDEGIQDGRIRPGHNILLEAFGAGFVWGSAFIKL